MCDVLPDRHILNGIWVWANLWSSPQKGDPMNRSFPAFRLLLLCLTMVCVMPFVFACTGSDDGDGNS